MYPRSVISQFGSIRETIYTEYSRENIAKNIYWVHIKEGT